MPPKKGRKGKRPQTVNGAKMRAQIDGVVTLVPQYIGDTKGPTGAPKPPRGYVINDAGGYDRKEGFKENPVQYGPYNSYRKRQMNYLRNKKRVVGLTPEESQLYQDLALKMQLPIEAANGSVTKMATTAAETLATNIGTDAAIAVAGAA